MMPDTKRLTIYRMALVNSQLTALNRSGDMRLLIMRSEQTQYPDGLNSPE